MDTMDTEGDELVRNLAGRMSREFRTITANDGEERVILAADAPEWMRGVVMAAHHNGHTPPDNDLWRLCAEACSYIASARDPYEWEGDDSYYELARWLARNPTEHAYHIERVLEEDGVDVRWDGKFWQLVQRGQVHQWEEVYDMVALQLREVAYEYEDEGGEAEEEDA